MNSGPLLFLGIFFSLATSFWGLVLLPQVQIGRQEPVVIETTGALYPTPRPGQAKQGAEVYRSLGCVECHSQQAHQTGIEFEVWLTDAGTNRPALIAGLAQLNLSSNEAARIVEQAPARLFGGLNVGAAQNIASRLTNGEAKAQAILVPTGPDIQRGWGKRATVAQDYLYDDPVLIGNQRIGPDLANFGARATLATNILLHLYKPQSIWPESMMPPHPFLFEKHPLNSGAKEPEGTILVMNRSRPKAGEPGADAIVPTPAASALVAYLTNLQAEVPLFEAPSARSPTNPPPAATATNAPAVTNTEAATNLTVPAK